MATRAISSSPLIDHDISATEPSEFSINSIKNRIADYVLTGRIMNNLQECVMIAGVVAAVVGIALTFFSGPPLLCACFTILLATSSVGIYHARRHAALQGLQMTADNLRTTQGRLEEVSNTLHQENNQFQITNQQLAQNTQTLQQENDRLQTTNQQLAQTNQEFRTTHGRFLRDFEATNQRLEGTNQRLTRQVQTLEKNNQELTQQVQGLEKIKGQLTQQVAELTLHVTQLSSSANRIREEMVRFQAENGHLAENVRGFDDSLNLIKQEIDVSGALAAQIAKLLSTQKQDFGGQLGELRQLIIDLRTNGSTNEKLTQLTILHDQFREIQVQCATERANLEAIRTDLALIQQDLRSGVTGLQEERAAIRTDFACIQKGMRNNVADQQKERAALHDEREGIHRQQERLEKLIDRISSFIEVNLEAPPFPDLPPLPFAVGVKA